MNRKVIYELTQKFLKENFKKVMICFTAVYVINFLITMLLQQTAPAVAADVQQLTIQQKNVNPFLSLMASIVQDFLNMLVMFVIVDAYRGKDSLSIASLIKVAKENTVTLLLAITMINVTIFIVNFIPFIGMLIAAILEFAATFALFILRENTSLQSYEGIVESFKMTRGHKWNLFVINLHYLWGMLLIGIVGSVLLALTPQLLSGVWLVVALGLFFFQPFIFISQSIYYVTLKRFNNREEPYLF